MNEINLKFILHLYTPYPQLTKLCFDEDGDVDEEFLNDRWNLMNDIHRIMKRLDPTLVCKESTSHWDPMFWKSTYCARDRIYNISLITDRDTNSSADKILSNDQPAHDMFRRWRIHDLELPDGSLISKGRFNAEDYLHIEEAIKSKCGEIC